MAKANGVKANLSMSVYKIDSLDNPGSTGLFSYIWLNSDLGMDAARDYFSGEVADSPEEMDNLMLTQGWRRFQWKEVFREPPKVTHLPEIRGHIVTARVLQEDEGQPRIFTSLGSPGKVIRAYGAWTDGDGQARFEIKDFYGAKRIILQTRSDSTQQYEIRVINPFSDMVHKDAFDHWIPLRKHEKALLSRSIAMQVQDIYYYDTYGERTLAPWVDSTAFYGRPDATFYLDDYTRFPVMEEVMREYVPGVFVRKRKDGFHFVVIDLENGGVLSGDPMILLDGVPVADTDDIMAIDPLRIRKLEVVNRQYYLGQAVFFWNRQLLFLQRGPRRSRT